jgi:agmatinase
MEERPPADCVFFGCPFDAGSTYRSGLRFGPKKIREVSQMLLTDCSNDYATWMDRNFGKMKIFDAGDCAPTPFDLITAVGQIYVFAKVLWNTSKKVVAIGGDHTLSWSFLAAARDKNEGKPVPIIHFDAHLDTGDEYLGSKLSHGTALGRAGAGGCIDFEKSTHIGIRGISSGPELQAHSDEEGYLTITMDEFEEIGPKEAAAKTKERIGDDPCVIIFDLDVMDTSDCPGVGFPTPGGMRNRELMTFLRELKGLNIMGGNVVEYTPDFDPTLSTAMMASQAAYEIMALALDNVEEEEEE